MIYSIIFVILACISAWFWRSKYVPAEVAQNAAAIEANGSADNLQRGFHGREARSRVWPGLACCVVPSLSFALSNLTSCLLSFATMACLLLGIFIRDFTPKLNLARIANGDTWLSEWFASPASKSWPDAGSWKKARADNNLAAHVQQSYANDYLKATILSAYRLCLLAALLLGAGAVAVASR